MDCPTHRLTFTKSSVDGIFDETSMCPWCKITRLQKELEQANSPCRCEDYERLRGQLRGTREGWDEERRLNNDLVPRCNAAEQDAERLREKLARAQRVVAAADELAARMAELNPSPVVYTEPYEEVWPGDAQYLCCAEDAETGHQECPLMDYYAARDALGGE